MKEKELTDEELVKALEFCINNLCSLKCPIHNDTSCVQTLKIRTLGIIHRQKAELERLTEENEYLDMVAKQALADSQNTQVQVDELTDKLGKVLSVIKADELLVSKGIEQAVKDTAKEIFTQIFESCVFSCKGNEDYKKGFLDALEQYDKQLRDLAKKKGVEVE